jgi:exoribonuclease-2
MISKNTPVLYKKNIAIISDIDSDKYVIKYCSSPATSTGKKAVYDTQKVREKDIIVLIPKEGSLENLLSFTDEKLPLKIQEAWELLCSDEQTSSSEISFSDLLELIDSSYSANETWAVFSALCSSFEFSLNEDNFKAGNIGFTPRTQVQIDELKTKANEKENAASIRQEFINRLKQHKLDLPSDSKYMGDIEALALGKTDKSKTLQEAGITQTPERAHKLLLDTGYWEITRNPYPVRWGLSMQSASEGLVQPPEEERVKVPGIAYAIDNEWSKDPDDAIAYDGEYLWVHIADPASTVMPDDSIDKVARARGATLYIPEGASRMLSEDSLADYALGLNEISRALSFKIKLDDNAAIVSCDVLKTIVDVKCLTYEKADEIQNSPELAPLYEIAKKNIEKRHNSGSVDINLPEVHITVDNQKKVSIEQISHPKASEVVREMMLLAGEGAAHFAFQNQIPFPYVSQEAPDLPASIPEGLAGQFRLVKAMHRRSVGVTPSIHSGLGIGMYSQVTSPLRRYSDLIAHQQLRAFLDGRELIDKDTMLERISAGDESAIASKKAERKSNMHWTLVYLTQNPDWEAEAVCIEQMKNQCRFMIPSLAQQTILNVSKPIELNETIRVKVAKIDIPTLEIVYRQI